MRDNRLNTEADVNLYEEALSNEIYVLTDRRKHLYAECRKPDADKQTLKAQTKGLTEELRVLRKKQRTCKDGFRKTRPPWRNGWKQQTLSGSVLKEMKMNIVRK